MEVSKRVAEISPSGSITIAAKIAALRKKGERIIGLNVGEPDFDSSSLESLADILEQRTLADDNHVFGENARERAVRVFSEESYKKEMLSAFSSAAF